MFQSSSAEGQSCFYFNGTSSEDLPWGEYYCNSTSFGNGSTSYICQKSELTFYNQTRIIYICIFSTFPCFESGVNCPLPSTHISQFYPVTVKLVTSDHHSSNFKKIIRQVALELEVASPARARSPIGLGPGSGLNLSVGLDRPCAFEFLLLTISNILQDHFISFLPD